MNSFDTWAIFPHTWGQYLSRNAFVGPFLFLGAELDRSKDFFTWHKNRIFHDFSIFLRRDRWACRPLLGRVGSLLECAGALLDDFRPYKNRNKTVDFFDFSRAQRGPPCARVFALFPVQRCFCTRFCTFFRAREFAFFPCTGFFGLRARNFAFSPCTGFCTQIVCKICTGNSRKAVF